MTADKENATNPQKKFKQNMKSQGKSEIRGVYLDDKLHCEVKKILRMYPQHREKIILFCNSLDLD